MDTLLTIVHVIVCLFLVCIVLLQHGKGADIGATFGGSSQSLFGSEGPLPLLNKITTASAIVFMLTSLTLAYLSSNSSTTSVMSEIAKPAPAKIDLAKPVAPVDKPMSTEAAAPVKEAAQDKPAVPAAQETPVAPVKPAAGAEEKPKQ